MFTVKSAYGPQPMFSWDFSTASNALDKAVRETWTWKQIWVYQNGIQISVDQLRGLARKEAQPR